jgi:hypothetical protein
MYPNQIVITFYLCVMSVLYISFTMFYFDLFQWIIGAFLLLILGHILYPVVCEILFFSLYLDLIEFEINYNYNYN